MISWDEARAFSDWAESVSHEGSWSESVDVGSGSRTSSTTVTVVEAIRSDVRKEGQPQTPSGVTVMVGDRWYRVRASDVSPAPNQQFVDAGIAYMVLDWETSSDQLIHKILTRRV